MARGGSRIGHKVAMPDHTHFTHKAEIAGRDSQTVEESPTSANLFPPTDNPGMNVASKSMARKGGAIKFSHMRG